MRGELWFMLDICRERQWAELAETSETETNKHRWTDGDLARD